MTGNTVLLGIVIGQADGRGVFAGTALVGFVILVAFAVRWLMEGSEPSRVVVYPLIVLSALLMGVQSAAVRRLAVADVSSTYITGTLTSLTARVVRRLRSAPGSVPRTASHLRNRQSAGCH